MQINRRVDLAARGGLVANHAARHVSGRRCGCRSAAHACRSAAHAGRSAAHAGRSAAHACRSGAVELPVILRVPGTSWLL